jgi:hypothetical protein
MTATYLSGAAITRRASKKILAGRILTGFVTLFLAFDLSMKVFLVQQAVDATSQLGYKTSVLPVLGILQLILLALYLVPRTAILGAVLWTGYLGGAIATHVRAGSPLFETVFPIIVAAMLWGGLWLRDSRIGLLLKGIE